MVPTGEKIAPPRLTRIRRLRSFAPACIFGWLDGYAKGSEQLGEVQWVARLITSLLRTFLPPVIAVIDTQCLAEWGFQTWHPKVNHLRTKIIDIGYTEASLEASIQKTWSGDNRVRKNWIKKVGGQSKAVYLGACASHADPHWDANGGGGDSDGKVIIMPRDS